MLGLPKGIVKLEIYNTGWVSIFEEEKRLIEESISDFIIDIQHVGSTSIVGLVSKPIIDIAIGVDSLKEVNKYVEPLEKLGYEYKGEAGVSGRLFFSKGDASSKTHHIHIVEVGSINWQNQILFRNYLRMHNEVRDEYAELKNALAQEFEKDRALYTAKKAEFVLDTIARAKFEFTKIEENN
jgi:GrpB-like predicted nucleotidyltransferase (UPF0157 family)